MVRLTANELSVLPEGRTSHGQRFSCSIGLFLLILTFLLAITDATQAIEIKAGDILVGNDGNSTLVKIDPNTGEQTLLASFTEIGENGIEYHGIHDLAFSPDGNLIVLQHNQTVSKLSLTTGQLTEITSEKLLGRKSSDTFVAGLTVDAKGDIYVAVYQSPYTGIVKVDPNTGAQTSVASGGYIHGPHGLGFLPSGELVVEDGSRLVGINTITHSQRLLATSLLGISAWGITIDNFGNIYLASSSTNKLIKVSSTGAASTAASGGFLDNSYDVAIEPGGTLLSFQTVSNALVRINPITKNQTIVSKGGFLSSSLSLVVAPFATGVSNGPVQLSIRQYPGISLDATPGATYFLEYTESLKDPVWMALTNIFISSSPYLFIDTSLTNRSARFYRTVPQ